MPQPTRALTGAEILRLETIRARDQHWELALIQQMQLEGLPAAVRDHQFSPSRKWAIDFAWPERFIGVEVEGGTKGVRCGACAGAKCAKCRWTGRVAGRHSSNKGYGEDARKYNHATLLGWRVYRFTSDMIKSGEAIRFLKDVVFNPNRRIE